MSFIYLASPYSHSMPAVRELRFHQANAAAAWLMRQGHVVFSPISHSHPIAAYLPEKQLLDHKFWMAQDLGILTLASSLFVLMTPGWDKSKGMAAELLHAKKHNIQIEYLKLEDICHI
ncbi:MAG: DUF1937 family protein [Minisyncoccota bacterium]